MRTICEPRPEYEREYLVECDNTSCNAKMAVMHSELKKLVFQQPVYIYWLGDCLHCGTKFTVASPSQIVSTKDMYIVCPKPQS
jgi:hypothetical protein